METTYKLTEKDVCNAVKLHCKRSKDFGLKRFLFPLFGFTLAIILNYKVLIYMVIGVEVFKIFVDEFLAPRKGSKIYYENKFLQKETTIKISEQGIKFSSESEWVFIKWKDFIKWKSDDKICLLYITSDINRVVPIRTLRNSNIEEEFFDFLNRNVPRAK